MAAEWTITIEGKNEFGEVCRMSDISAHETELVY